MKKIAIIGGGAAGLAAAISAAHVGPKAAVVVFEAADRVGKSILASGNGRCNFSNESPGARDYFNAEFVRQSFEAVPPADVLGFFSRIGLMWHAESEGRLYPLTNKASTVLDVLRIAASEAGVEERCGNEVVSVTPVRHQQLVSLASGQTEYFDAVIVACGGAACRSILPPNYTYENTLPVLGPLKTDAAAIRGLNNIRVRCEVSCKGHGERGELLFRDYGVSGIAVFNLSRYARPGDTLLIDFLPDLGAGELRALLEQRIVRFAERSAVDLLAGMLQPLVARAVLASAGLDAESSLAPGDAAALAAALKGFGLQVEGIGDIRQCQVRRGGFAVDDFDPATMESRLDRGLYLAGEALDVDGPCGGYNLHWAWASGMIAGRAAAAQLADGGMDAR